jgi:hypothetical protein
MRHFDPQVPLQPQITFRQLQLDTFMMPTVAFCLRVADWPPPTTVVFFLVLVPQVNASGMVSIQKPPSRSLTSKAA